jgi:hypothetical protein
MKSSRGRLILAQSVITAALLGVVAVTLLSPNGDVELFGVGLPGGDPVAENPTHEPGQNGRDGQREAPGTREQAPAAGDTAAAADGVSPPDLALTGPNPPAPGGNGAGPGGDDGPGGGAGNGEYSPGPPGDQYADTLARLSDAIR